jgi:hypothetical protein
MGVCSKSKCKLGINIVNPTDFHMVQDEVTFFGHPNVRSLHGKTVEITKDENLTLRGDCIIGVRASKACSDLDENLRRRLSFHDSVVKIEVIVGAESFVINGMGDERLTLQNPHDIVIRKTSFVCPRTMSVRCDKASSEMPRKIVRMLQDKEAKGIFRVTVE